MVNFQQLKDAKADTLQGHVDGWGNVVQTAGTLKDSAGTNVHTKVRFGGWQGQSGTDAAARSLYLEKELGFAKTESEAIKKIVEWGKGQIALRKGELDKVIQEVNKDTRLKISDKGNVEIRADKLGGAQSGPPSVLEALEAQNAADNHNKNIKSILAMATFLDGAIAAKLRAAANIDNPNDAKNPRFNADAAKEGSVPDEKDQHFKSQKDLFEKYRVLDGHKLPGGLPEELGASWEEAILRLPHVFSKDEIEKLKGVAMDESTRRYEPEGLHNGQADAMRHTLFAALLQKELGTNAAVSIAGGHEMIPNNPKNEMAMDLHNNSVGYQIARDHPHASREELANIVAQYVRDGKLITTDPDTGQLYHSDGRPIPP